MSFCTICKSHTKYHIAKFRTVSNHE